MTLTDEQRERVRDAIAEALGDAYDCMRVWSAWGYGTMGPDDFCLVAEDESRLSEITDAAINAIFATTTTAVDQELRNVDGLTREEFEHRLRVGYQHDNVRARERGRDAPLNCLTAEQEREIMERIELNYPTPKVCPGCHAWDLGMAEVNFIQDCAGCAERMRKAAGVYDRCEVCHGMEGGIPGNENVVDGKIVCDYCHAKGASHE